MTSPLIQQLRDHDLWQPPKLPGSITSSDLYQNAVEDGWHEWIETPLDFEAMKHGYVYDQSRGLDDKPAYWLDGHWVLHDGTVVPIEDEEDAIGYVGMGDLFMRFAEGFLFHTKEPLAGHPYTFLPWHRRIVAPLFGWVHSENKYRRYQNVVVEVAKKNAKALCGSTPIPTANGFKPHGSLVVGDKLFDQHGKPCEVIHVHPPTEINYEVHFSNGEVIRCNEEHLWVVEEHGWLERYIKYETLPLREINLRWRLARFYVRKPDGERVTIVAVRKIPPVPGNCITVSGDGTYLCGQTMIPTHNSALMSVIALYCMYAEGTPKAYVFSCACDRNQARIIYDESKHYVMGSPYLANAIEVVDSRGRLVHQPSGSFYAVLSADAHRNDGIDSYCTLIDEIHRHKDRRLYTVMKRAGRARPQKLLAVITTYGPSLSDGSIWAEVHNEAKAILAGQRPEAWRHLCFIASAEPIPVTLTAPGKIGDTTLEVSRLEQPLEKGTLTFDSGDEKVDVVVTHDAPRFGTSIQVEPLTAELQIYAEAEGNTDWKSDHAIRRANPAVGQIFPVEEIRKDINEARSPEAEAETKQLSLNIVSGSGRKWISTTAWQALSRYQVQPRGLAGRRCFGGLDLSFSNDLTAFALAFPNWGDGETYESVESPRLDLLVWAWLPSFAIEDREEKEKMPYRLIASQDYLIPGKGPVRLCEGPTIDYAQLVTDIKEITAFFDCRCVAYDNRFAQFCRTQLEEAGLLMVEHRQGPVGMAPACKRFHEMVYGGILAHGDNPVLDRAIEGAQLAPPNRDGMTYITKSHSLSRIDPAVAAVMAVHFACDPPEGTASSFVSIWG